MMINLTCPPQFVAFFKLGFYAASAIPDAPRGGAKYNLNLVTQQFLRHNAPEFQ